MKAEAAGVDFAAYNFNGERVFRLKSNGISYIAGWSFDNNTLYTGTAAVSGYTKTGEITLGPSGLRGYKWRFENDGSGALAGGKISWDKDGNLTVDAQISANNITSGTISTASIKCEGKWYLSQNGDGYIANKNIEWDKDGNINVKGSFSQNIHYAYKCDVTIVSRVQGNLEDEVELKLNNHLYLATNVLDEADFEILGGNEWPYQLDYKHYYTIRLPLNYKFIGKEVKIYDCNYGPFTKQPYGWCNTTIKVENDVAFVTKNTYEDDYAKNNLWKSITIRGGYASFVCIPTTNGKLTWICVDFYGAKCEGIDIKGQIHYDLYI